MNKNRALTQDLSRVVLAILFLVILLSGCFWVLKPFLPALIWATTIVIATWPLMLKVQRLSGGRRGTIVTVMTVILLLLFIVPFWFTVSTIIGNADAIIEWGRSLQNFSLPPLPEWLVQLPLVGNRIAAGWAQLGSGQNRELIARFGPYIGELLTWFISQVGSFGILFVHIVFTIILSAVLYLNGEIAAREMRRFARRLAGERGDSSVVLAAQATRAVALGIMVTAIVQALGAGIAFFIAGIPYAVLLTALTFVFCVVQIGASPVLLATALWLFWQGNSGWGIAMLIWSALVVSSDNVLRPWLIKRGADLPLLLVFAGVLGGLFAFGIIGLFIGPVILAVSYKLLQAWMAEGDIIVPPEVNSEVTTPETSIIS